MIVCGYETKESLKHATFLLDVNVTLPHPVDLYQPGTNRTVLTRRQYNNDECTFVRDVPVGHHVLSVVIDPNITSRAVAAVSHIITFD